MKPNESTNTMKLQYNIVLTCLLISGLLFPRNKKLCKHHGSA